MPEREELKPMGGRSVGTWHVDDPNSKVNWQVAMSAWAEATLPELERVASVYEGFITYTDLAERLQEVTGYRTRTVLSYWIGKVLDKVVIRTLTEDLPPLTALVVQKGDGLVGDGYYNREHPPGSIDETEELNDVADADRLLCYRAYGADVPADARPQRTALRKDKSAPRPRQPEMSRARVCPSCRLELPLSGQCDSCD
ncbi:hypothetical protein BW730_14340 [Tessaracoccus aquimaris]|uniref:Uncharacterized protein n=1 Tax=Tessaracoccus aquimaris TaxID=1332264 RepID=A0A1Q2CR55_9ACTN|nr:hypothetical protein [Tessaracoccus aquimaris]AQP48510.1 hypothetical protein BW730_14340 [Tessaracoccus aquimaris]